MLPADLRAARQQLGLSQAELGRQLGVSPNTIYRWEQGDLAIRHPHMLALALDQLQRHPRPYSRPCARCGVAHDMAPVTICLGCYDATR